MLILWLCNQEDALIGSHSGKQEQDLISFGSKAFAEKAHPPMKGNLAWNQCVWVLNSGSHWVFPSNDIRIRNYSALHVVLVVQRASVCFVCISQIAHLLFPKPNDGASFIPPHWKIAALGFRNLFYAFPFIPVWSFFWSFGGWLGTCWWIILFQ